MVFLRNVLLFELVNKEIENQSIHLFLPSFAVLINVQNDLALSESTVSINPID